MSAVPSDIAGFGAASVAPRQNPSFAPGPDFTTEDYYVFSRCDGHASARDIIVMVGLGSERGGAILAKLRRLGALLLPGESPESLAEARRLAEGSQRSRPITEGSLRGRPGSDGTLRGRPLSAPTVEPLKAASIDLERVIDLGSLGADEAAALDEDVELTERERKRIIEMVRLDARGTLYDLLGVLPTVDKKELKRAYFRLSKEFHPDRYYKKALGSFGPWLTHVFESVTRAFEMLSDDRRRGSYEARLRGEVAPAPVGHGHQSRSEHAAELFDRACDHENRGQLAEAVKMFGAAIRADEQPRYLRRAALCCMAAGELSTAEEYANKGAGLRPSDPAYARVLAEVLRASGKLAEAENTLIRALDLKTENDMLMGELRADLAAVRAARGAV